MSNANQELKSRVIFDLNDSYGDNLLDLEICFNLQNKLLEERTILENELDVSSDSVLGITIFRGQDEANKSSDLVCKGREYVDNINKDLIEISEIKKEFELYTQKFNQLQCLLQYMNVVKQVEYLGSELFKEIVNQDDEKCTTLYANLTEISRNLEGTLAINLLDYLRDVIFYWHNILKEKLFKDFDEVLKKIKWPFVSTNFSLVTPSEAQIQKLQSIAEYLLQIEIPSETNIPLITKPLLCDFPPLCLPIHFLVIPLKKRFNYHFYGSRQTNRADKPEWYFTQILTWIRDHSIFVDKYIQPVIDKLGLHHIVAKTEFIRGLVQMASEKLYSDLPNLQFDDFIFSHTIDEALGFEKELKQTYEYPQNQPSILAVLTQAKVLVKWLAMEKKYATEKMDAILPPNSLEAFEPITSDVDQLKIATCTDAFITLLQAITDRYESLQQPGHRLQFLDLQLELLDDFRIRLLQLVNADKEQGDIIESRIPLIANSIYYIENVIMDWGATLHFLNLYYYRNHQLEGLKVSEKSREFDIDDVTLDIDTDNVFAETLALYRHMRIEILDTMVITLIAEIKSTSRAYLRQKWSSIEVVGEFRTLSLSPLACSMFEVLSKGLYQLQKRLQNKLFVYVWRSIAKHLDMHLFENLIMENRFSEGGALQLKFDIIRNLIPIFSQYCEIPENYFSKVVQSCTLLNLNKGSAILLKDTIIALEGATGVEDTRGAALKEMGVRDFSPQMALAILNRRADLTTNRMDID